MEFGYKFNLTPIGFKDAKYDLGNLILIAGNHQMKFIFYSRKMYFEFRNLTKKTEKMDLITLTLLR